MTTGFDWDKNADYLRYRCKNVSIVASVRDVRRGRGLFMHELLALLPEIPYRTLVAESENFRILSYSFDSVLGPCFSITFEDLLRLSKDPNALKRQLAELLMEG